MLFLLMMLAVICLWWLAQMKDIYQRTPNKKDFWTFYRFRYPLGIMLLVILPLIAVNKWVPNTVEVHGQEAVRFGERTDDYRMRIRGYQEMLAEDSLDLDLHFRYLEDYFAYQWGQDRPMVIIERYRKYKTSADPTVANIGYLGELMAETFSYRFEEFEQLLKQIPTEGTRKYMHHCTGRYLYYYHNTDSAIHHWQQEIATGGDTAHTIEFWSRVLEWEDRRDDLGRLIDQPWAVSHFAVHVKETTAFREAHAGTYIEALAEQEAAHWNWIGFFAGLLVTLVWLFYLHQINVFARLPWKYILSSFTLGFVMTFLVYPISDLIQEFLYFELSGGIINDFFYCVITIGAVEETVKILPVLLLMRFTKAFREPMDYIVLAAASALGFAFNENLLYFDEGQLNIIFTRALTAVLMHLTLTTSIAYALVLALFKHPGKSTWAFGLAGFGIASVVHGVYDFWLINEQVQDYSILSMIIYLISAHMFTIFLTNAVNNSSGFSHEKAFNNNRLQFYMVNALIGIFMVEYIAMAAQWGAEYANINFFASTFQGFYLIFFIGVGFSRFDLVQGYWEPLQVPVRFFLPKFSFPQNHVGVRIKLTNHSRNAAMEKLLPVEGKLVDRLVISRQTDWFLVRLDTPIPFSKYNNDQLILQAKPRPYDLDSDQRVLCRILLLKKGYELDKNTVRKKDCVSGGWVFSLRQFDAEA